MKRKILTWLLVMALLPSGMAASPLTARADGAEGEWVLAEVTDKIAEDWNDSYPDDNPPWETAVKYRYARSDFAVDWYDVYDGERSEGTLGVIIPQ